MSLLIGQPIDARQLEQATGFWSSEQFASMCNDLIWAVSGQKCNSLPEFTIRQGRDGGIDAEWSLEMPDLNSSIPNPFFVPGWNVFQYKKRDPMAQDRRRIFSGLKSDSKGAVNDVIKKDKNGRRPNHYALFVNIDLNGSDKALIKNAILNDCTDPSNLKVDIIGAAELAAMLNNHPHLRASYFSLLSFKTWQEAKLDHSRQGFVLSGVDLVGRETEIAQLRSLINDSRTKIIVLSGPHHIGKSRLALEATKDRPHDVVVALDPRSMNPKDYLSLSSEQGEAICIVEDPEPDSLEELISIASTLSNLKLIITLPTIADAPASVYAHREIIQCLNLTPLSDEDSEKLLKAANNRLSFEIEDWIVGHAGGIPGTILAAASMGNELRDNLTDFISAIGKEFEQRIKNEFGPDALKCTRLLSILTHVGISGTVESELKHITEIFGDGWQPHKALSYVSELEKTGLIKKCGLYVEVTLPMFANYLVSQLLQGRINELFALFARLDEQGRYRFIKRISEIEGKEVNNFWDAMFAYDGLFGNFDSALNNAYLLRLIACTVPDRVLKLLKTGLQNRSVEERLAIEGDERGELRWLIEQLLFRNKTSKDAVRLLSFLAEAENEEYSNNATGVFIECFHVRQPQLPLSLYDRIDLLKEFSSDSASKKIKLIIVKAIGGSLNRMGSFRLRRSEGPTPLDKPVIYTDKKIYDYPREVTDILFSLSKDKYKEVASAALNELPKLTAELAIQGRPDEGMERFKKIVDLTLAGNTEINVTSLFDAIRLIRDSFSKIVAKEETSTDQKNEYQQYLFEVDEIKNKLENSSFPLRLKRWIGRWIYEDDMKITTAEGKTIFENIVKKLAKEVIEQPEILNGELIEWLLSPSAQKSHYFFNFLGEIDTHSIYLKKMEELTLFGNGTPAFSLYCWGWMGRDKKSAEEYLEQLSKADKISGAAIVQATLMGEANQKAVNRVESQIKRGCVDPQTFAQLLFNSGWLKNIKMDQFENLLIAIAGENFEHSSVLINIFHSWLYEKRDFKGNLVEIAWRCLENSLDSKASFEVYHADDLAAKLTHFDKDRGFNLFEKLINGHINRDRLGKSTWNPLDEYEGREFRKTLYNTDKKNFINSLLKTAKKDDLNLYVVSFDLRDSLDFEENKDLLLSLAKESVENARIIASWFSTANKEFWPIACELLKKYPNDEDMLNALASGIRQDGNVITGPMSSFYENRRKEAEKILNEPSTPPEARAWLKEIVDRLQKDISQQIIWEYDGDVNDLRRFIKDKNSPQRTWAIGRLLKYAEWKDIRRLLRVEDIEEALPQINLPDKKRKMLEKLLNVWAYG